MKFKNFIVLACSVMSAAAASAGVVYEWKTVSTSPTISSVKGRLEISDAAWAAGSLNYQMPDTCFGVPGCTDGDPFSPIVNFYFSVNTTTSNGINVFPQTASPLWAPPNWLHVNLDFTHPGGISGNLFAHDGQSDTWLSSAGALWTIDRFGSDSPYFGYDCFAGGCSGATGYWVQAPAQVPAPATVTLLGAGLVGVAAMGRRRKKA